MIEGSITPLMDELVAAAERVNTSEGLQEAAELNIYRWRPLGAPNTPALWHWMAEPPPPELKTVVNLRDHFAISAFIGTRHVDQAEDMVALEKYCDAYREQLDPLLFGPQTPGGPLNGTARWAKRNGIRLVATAFAGVELIAFEFPLELDVDRLLKTTN